LGPTGENSAFGREQGGWGWLVGG